MFDENGSAATGARRWEIADSVDGALDIDILSLVKIRPFDEGLFQIVSRRCFEVDRERGLKQRGEKGDKCYWNIPGKICERRTSWIFHPARSKCGEKLCYKRPRKEIFGKLVEKHVWTVSIELKLESWIFYGLMPLNLFSFH